MDSHVLTMKTLETKYKHHKHYSALKMVKMSNGEFGTFESCLNIGALRLLGINHNGEWSIAEDPIDGGIDIYYN